MRPHRARASTSQKGACEEGALAAGDAVGAEVAGDVGAGLQGLLDGGDGCVHAGVVGRQVALEQSEEETCVHVVAVGGAYVAVAVRAEAAGVDEFGDGLSFAPPPVVRAATGARGGRG